MDISKFFKNYKPKLGGIEILRYIGPGFLVTVGFIDPGNWASNVLAGSSYGYKLLWMVTLSTILLIILQHNVAHLGIVQDFAFLKLQQSSTSRGSASFYLEALCLLQSQLRLQKFFVLPLV
jgi:NRAMP (natural resistance-associated macrophage protein)-like metal ion transporter